MTDIYNLMASIVAEFPLSRTVPIGRITCARCMMDSNQRQEISILWKILPDDTTFVRYMTNIYHTLTHQDDTTNRFILYNLEVEQLSLLIILARLVQAEHNQFGGYIEGLCLEILRNREDMMTCIIEVQYQFHGVMTYDHDSNLSDDDDDEADIISDENTSSVDTASAV